jgi:hypothetical protein
MTIEYFGADKGSLNGEAAKPATGPLYYLPELPSTPWRSLGRRLDYANWTDRERFLELDAAILLRQELDLVRSALRRPETEQMAEPHNSSRFTD